MQKVVPGCVPTVLRQDSADRHEQDMNSLKLCGGLSIREAIPGIGYLLCTGVLGADERQLINR